MSSNVENNSLDLRTVRAEFNNPNCLGIIMNYVGVPDPTMLDEPLAEIFWRQITTQATRQNDDGEFALFSRFVGGLDIAAHLPCLAKIETAFSTLFDVEKGAGSKITVWRQARGIAEPKEEDVLLKRMGAIAGFAMTTMQDDALDRLTDWFRSSGFVDQLPHELFIAAAGKRSGTAARRAWINGHTDDLSRVSINNSLMPRILTFPPEMGAFKQLTELRIEGICWLSPAVGELCNLRDLSCIDGNLHTIPNSITKLKNLTSLRLSQNHWLESLPALDQLPKLRLLNITFTCLSVLQSPCLGPLRRRGCKVNARVVLKVPGSTAQLLPGIGTPTTQ